MEVLGVLVLMFIALLGGFAIGRTSTDIGEVYGHRPPRPQPPGPPPPPWVAQHKPRCTVQKTYNRKRVCGDCGSELVHRHPKPPKAE